MRWKHEGRACGATSRPVTRDLAPVRSWSGGGNQEERPLRIETPPCPGTLHMRHPSGCSDHDLGYATCSVCNRVVQIRGADMEGVPEPEPPAPPVHTLPRGSIHVARAGAVYPSIPDGGVSLVISDGPYNMRKAAWDRFASWDAFRDWYRPHVEAWGRVCAASATVYLWGTQRSVRELAPVMEAAGWVYRVSVTWDKRSSPSCMAPRMWPDVTETCDVWSVGSPFFERPGKTTNIWPLHAMGSASELSRERLRESEISAPAIAGRAPRRAPLHPCQKPLAFYDRIIRASSRPGDLVLEPFGGTCRAAVACEALPEGEARRYVCIEPDEDGRGYVPAVLRSMQLNEAPPKPEPNRPVQGSLFDPPVDDLPW